MKYMLIPIFMAYPMLSLEDGTDSHSFAIRFHLIHEIWKRSDVHNAETCLKGGNVWRSVIEGI